MGIKREWQLSRLP